jgi:hypothetical protein
MNAKEAVLFKLPKSSVYGVVVRYNEYMQYQKQGERLDEMLKEELCFKSNAKVPVFHLTWLTQGLNPAQETDNRGINMLCYVC